MWRNNFKIIIRTLWKQKLFTGLNMIGLALGLSICCLLLLFITNERSFNKFHDNYDNIYRVLVTASYDGQSEKWANAPNVVGPTAQENIPAVITHSRLLKQ